MVFGDESTQHIYRLLEREHKLMRAQIPSQLHRLKVFALLSLALSVLQFFCRLSGCHMLHVRSSLLDLCFYGLHSFLSQPLLSCYKGSPDFQHYPDAEENQVSFLLFSCSAFSSSCASQLTTSLHGPSSRGIPHCPASFSFRPFSSEGGGPSELENLSQSSVMPL